jgi:hypothetical protein
MRPRGDPDGLAAAGRMLVAAAAEMERIRDGVAGLGGGLDGPDGWQGQASEAYRARDRLLEAGVGGGADALRQAGAGLSELSAGLAGAQALWDHASSLAASAGLLLDPAAPDGPLALPLLSVDPRVATAARVAELAREATEQATSADRSAAASLAGAAETAGRAGGAVAATAGGRGAGPGPLAGGPGAPTGGVGAAGGEAGGAGAGHSRGESKEPSLLARGLAIVDRVGVAVGAGLAAIESRAGALTRLVQSGREPAEGLAAVRALAALERTAFTDTLAAFLPLGGPAITLAANLVGAEGGEPLPRALVRSLGESLGADAGQRVGLAACGAETFATEGAGAFLCPAVAIATTSVGARLGGAAAVRIYDELGSERSPTRRP